jgi:hypothetical protein
MRHLVGRRRAREPVAIRVDFTPRTDGIGEMFAIGTGRAWRVMIDVSDDVGSSVTRIVGSFCPRSRIRS